MANPDDEVSGKGLPGCSEKKSRERQMFGRIPFMRIFRMWFQKERGLGTT